MSKKPTPKAKPKSKPISKEQPDDAVINDQDENDAQGAELSLDEQLELMQEKADVNWDKYLRAVAELENVRKRASRDVENARKYALEGFAREFLVVNDSLELAANSEESNLESLQSGLKATLSLMLTTMEQFGFEVIDPHGEPFDAEYHEAMSMQPSDDVEPGSVLTVFQKGYTLNNRLLRPARVIVAADPE
ncbi:MAG: nucleotide exchange factor GrpE [Woeseiaceae bacterium]|jgi:molecular chaperone GrpE|nr:nucleotide exchange factor GrpE [Woeseiaceae bacterium]MDG1015757.1 nucleotide exchange factor GrpE [Woeseiaceae bacterium]